MKFAREFKSIVRETIMNEVVEPMQTSGSVRLQELANLNGRRTLEKEEVVEYRELAVKFMTLKFLATTKIGIRFLDWLEVKE